MGQLDREYIPDITTQRFQENVSRLTQNIQNTQNTVNSQFTTNLATANSQIKALQAIVSAPASYFDITFSFTGGAVTISHSLGTTPTSWVITDLTYTIVPFSIPFIYRVAWTSTDITFNIQGGGHGTYKIRLS
jgi:hypothetical protein